MNKYKEAFRTIERNLEYSCDTELELIYDLVKKATPKKVIRKPVKHYVDFYCPNCNRKLSSRVKYHFCPKKDCGQALDWGDDS